MIGGEPPDRTGIVMFVPEDNDTRERVAARVDGLAQYTDADTRQRVAARVDALAQRTDGADVGEFARRYYAGVADEDLAAQPIDALAERALAHWQLARWRTRGTAIVNVSSSAHGHTVIDIVNDDMPFIVDSVTMALERHELGIHLVVHPIMRVRRTAAGELIGLAPDDASLLAGDLVLLESWVHIEVDRETNEATLEAVHDDLQRVLADVRTATSDWAKMLSAFHHVCGQLGAHPPPIDAGELVEGRALLQWLGDQHFTFLAYRAYDLLPDDTLRPVPGTGLGLLRGAPDVPSASFARLPLEIRAKARERTLLVLTKTNRRSTVHRPTFLDYVGVKRYDAAGNVIGEHRFLGLYTSNAYTSSASEVPVLRRKVAQVIERAGFLPASHDQKDLAQILDTYPRDDLFQLDVDTLYAIAMGILRLQERRQVRLFVSREPYGRFVSCLVFLPRDRYTTQVREHIAGLLTQTLGALSCEWNTRLPESVLARLHFVLRVDPTMPHEIDVRSLEARVAAAARAWVDDLRDALIAARGEEEGLEQSRIWLNAFPGAYQDDFGAAETLADLAQLERLGDTVPLGVRMVAGDACLDLKLYGIGAQPSLSEVLPRLGNMGVIVDDEHPYTIVPAGADLRWIKWFRLRLPQGTRIDAATLRLFEDAFLAIIDGRAEDDGFNRLVLRAGLAWREVALVRAYGRYLRQTGTPFSQAYMEETLSAHAPLARRLVELFVARFDPWTATTSEGDDPAALIDDIRAQLDAVTSLDEDRILRAFLHLVLATLRTNWFQASNNPDGDPTTVVLKLDPSKIPDLPLPRPMFEVFVYTPRVEGVHLRAGRVARGGIRWSDRREDFRTEVLGLMKAQRVKNAVIVPAGAKGGFVLKRPPADPATLHAEVEACYRIFIGGLLDVTDNLVANEAGEQVVVPPQLVVRYDGDDPYLVVAADKGTATFSDVANEIALARGFWLGDAFASGGAHGYDHKEMGITARGAWESVRRHFRHLDLHPDRDDFTVVGIGDMSGDVFGNGMLLSHHIKLVAAFDHRHVFLDPTPDPAKSFEERRRLFELPRSSWDDYDRALISPGGGVFPRMSKSVAVTPEVRIALGLAEGIDALPPNELIRAVLRAPVDLLYNGGIGTYVKAHTETHADVGDKTCDAVRVDGRELQARSVAEGGNLGFTQLGRVEYALGGGRINTDAIDNSAGVDTSDREVNLKILLDGAVRAHEISEEGRNQLLDSMTDEVAALVLRDNYRQSRALDNAQAQSPEMEEVHARFIRMLEAAKHLDRTVERLPTDDQLADRQHAGLGLTTPELAVLLAYAKIELEEALLESDLPEDPDFLPELERSFPTAVRERCRERIRTHPLRREITATALVNGLVNRAGMTFTFRLREETGATAPDVVRAHEAARAIFDQDALWREIEALDDTVGVEVQTQMYLASRRLVERATRWLLRQRRQPLPVAETAALFAVPIARLAAIAVMSERCEATANKYSSQGVPRELALRVAALDRLPRALDVVELADTHHAEVEEVATVYDEVGDRLRLEWLVDRIVELPREDRWDALARNALREDAAAQHRRIVDAVMKAGSYDAWASTCTTLVARVLTLLDDIRAHGVFDIATLSVALRELRALA
jgi:glutamate dehydrogenase